MAILISVDSAANECEKAKTAMETMEWPTTEADGGAGEINRCNFLVTTTIALLAASLPVMARF